MSEKNRKDEALDSANAAGVIEYTPEQVAEHDRREARAAEINKKLPKLDEAVAGQPEAAEPEPKKKKHA